MNPIKSKMKIKMKYLVSYSVFAALFVWAGMMVGCSDEAMPGGMEEAGHGKVSFVLEVPRESEVRTKAVSVTQATSVKNLYVLAFADGGEGSEPGFAYARKVEGQYTIDGGEHYLCSFNADFTYGERQYFVFVANAGEAVENLFPSASGKGMDEVAESLAFENCDWVAAHKALPLWGKTLEAYTQESVSGGSLNRVRLVRAVAAVDVVVNGDGTLVNGLEDFKIAHVEVRDAPGKGSVAPYAGNYEHRNDTCFITAPSVPSDAGSPRVEAYRVGDGSAVSELRASVYLPEWKAPASSSAAGDMPCLLIGGYYGKGNVSEETWYRVDFVQDTGDGLRYADLLRNTRYVLNISQVSGKGHATADEAYRNASENMRATLDLRPDEAEGLTCVVYNASEFLATNTVSLNVGTGFDESLEVLTNASGGWQLADVPEWLEVSAGSGVVGERASLKFTVKSEGDGGLREAVLTLSAGRLKQTVAVTERESREIWYLSAYAKRVITPEELGFDASKFILSGGIALHGKYLVVGNSYSSKSGSVYDVKPVVAIYDLENNKVVATIEEWEHDGNKLNFAGDANYSDYIDDIAVDEVDNYLYVVRRQSCVDVFDVSNPESPTYVTRIGKLLNTASGWTTIRNSSAVGFSKEFVFLRTNAELNAYYRETIKSAGFGEIAPRAADLKMPVLGYQYRQFAKDESDGTFWLTEYGNDSFMGVYQLYPEKVDADLGSDLQLYRAYNFRQHPVQLDFHPTGMLVDGEKVYMTKADGTITVLDRASFSVTANVKAHIPLKRTESSVGNYQFGRMAKIYKDSRGEFWTCDQGKSNIVCIGLEMSAVIL